MKILFLSALLFAGCVSTANNGTATWALIAQGGLDFGVSLAVPPVLDKNPGYAAPLQAVGAGIATAFGASDLTPDLVVQTVQAIGFKAGLDPSVQSILATALNKGIAEYNSVFGTKVASATDPNVRAILQGIADGIAKGVADWQSRQPPTQNQSFYYNRQGKPVYFTDTSTR